MFAVLIATFQFVAGASMLHHATTKTHVFCAEHGHLVHADGSDSPAGFSQLDGGHEDCHFDQAGQGLATFSYDLTVTSLPVGVATSFFGAATRLVQLDVVSYAPKTSPPHA